MSQCEAEMDNFIWRRGLFNTVLSTWVIRKKGMQEKSTLHLEVGRERLMGALPYAVAVCIILLGFTVLEICVALKLAHKEGPLNGPGEGISWDLHPQL